MVRSAGRRMFWFMKTFAHGLLVLGSYIALHAALLGFSGSILH